MSKKAISDLTGDGNLCRRKVISAAGGFGIFCVLTSGSVIAQNSDNQSPQENANKSTASISFSENYPAWEVDTIDGSYTDTTDEENPTISLSKGVRYTLINESGDRHPLSLRDEAGNPLLSQAQTGSYEDNEAVDWEKTDNKMSFTLTSELADDLSLYICTIHSSMKGNIKILDTETEPNSTTETEPNSTTETEPNSTTETEPNSTTETEPNSTTETEPNSTTETEPNSTTETEPNSTTETEPNGSVNKEGVSESAAPGLGIVGSIMSITGTGYLLKRRSIKQKTDE